MLWRLKGIQDYTVWATDGDIGELDQLYIDVTRWTVRFLVVDTGAWLPGRKVLAPILAVRVLDQWGVFHLDLTRKQLQHCPPVDPDRPISQGAERDYMRHFGLPLDWCEIESRPGRLPTLQSTIEEQCEPYLISSRELAGLHLHAPEADIGHIKDVVIDDTAWTVPYLLVDTGHWLPGRMVLVPTTRLHGMDLRQKRIHTDLTRDRLRHAPEADLGAPFTAGLKQQLDDYYQSPAGLPPA